ncbi:MAG: hypothetical protein HXX14_17885 [Bacteroidetes bacterium]|nr:hypothetical protein [Bacteroidota bacterium]
MIPQNIKDLIRALITKTTSKKAIWEKTSRSNKFKLLFEKGVIKIDNWSDNDNLENVNFGIYNAFGDRIYNFCASEKDKEFNLLMELYDATRRAVNKVDETIIGLFDEVNSEKSIGNMKSKIQIF